MKTKTAQLPQGGNEHILFVDDEEMLVTVGSIMLETFGYTVTKKIDARDALETFKSGPEQFDLVITDQSMPYFTGIELSRKLLSIRSDIPIILYTGGRPDEYEEIARKIGIRELTTKPFNRKQLGDIARKTLDG